LLKAPWKISFAKAHLQRIAADQSLRALADDRASAGDKKVRHDRPAMTIAPTFDLAST